MEHHAEILRGGIWRPRGTDWQDLVATVLLVGTIVLLGLIARQMLAPFAAARQPEISLSLAALPSYALRTTIRMLAALVASFCSLTKERSLWRIGGFHRPRRLVLACEPR
jgi:NitT/TauT family transport system permease protein